MQVVELLIDNLKVDYTTLTALDISRVVAHGSVIGVIGHNGAGKSTLIKTVLKLLQPLRGSVSIRLQAENRVLVPEYDMAFCPENGAIFLDISVEEYIKLWSRIKCGDANYYQKAGAWTIELLDLGPLLQKKGRELSKGQRRRVQTAVGFLIGASFLLFDEPFDGLDIERSNQLVEIIRSQTMKSSFLVSSHRMDIIERLVDYLIVLQNGKICAIGRVEEVIKTLSGTATLLRNLHNSVDLITKLRKQLPQTEFSLVGDHILATGGFKRNELENLVSIHQKHQVVFSEAKASLIDAMSYHLKHVRSDSNLQFTPPPPGSQI